MSTPPAVATSSAGLRGSRPWMSSTGRNFIMTSPGADINTCRAQPGSDVCASQPGHTTGLATQGLTRATHRESTHKGIKVQVEDGSRRVAPPVTTRSLACEVINFDKYLHTRTFGSLDHGKGRKKRIHRPLNSTLYPSLKMHVIETANEGHPLVMARVVDPIKPQDNWRKTLP